MNFFDKINNFINKYINKKSLTGDIFKKYMPEKCNHCGEDIMVDGTFIKKTEELCKRCYLLKNIIDEGKEQLFKVKDHQDNLIKEKNNLIDSINRNNIFNNTYPDNRQELNNDNLIFRLNEIKQQLFLV